MAPVGVWLPRTEVLMLASRFGMDAHTCEAARNIMVCAQNNGCFDTTLYFPNSPVVSLASEFQTRCAQNPSEKHLACAKSPGFLRACDLKGGLDGTVEGLKEPFIKEPSSKS